MCTVHNLIHIFVKIARNFSNFLKKVIPLKLKKYFKNLLNKVNEIVIIRNNHLIDMLRIKFVMTNSFSDLLSGSFCHS